MKKRFENVYQFKITLLEIDPPIWRRIQVPETYSFWDLHVAIQDSMGWEDCHLHEFIIRQNDKKEPIVIGMPGEDDEMFGHVTLPGHKESISKRFDTNCDTAIYIYDMGDDWTHHIQFEGILPRKGSVKYPICLEGERACPPEDCGGVTGYLDIIIALKKKRRNAEDKELLEWLGDYDPEQFDPKGVIFDDPEKRFKMAFSWR